MRLKSLASTRPYYFNTLLFALTCLLGCARETPGPDKVFAGEAQGAVTGAGAGAVTGFQLGAGIGPGAFVGAGLGVVAGGLQGFVQDQSEEQLMRLAVKTREEREIVHAQEILEDHFRRRAELHPTRDIFPADLFFYGDEVKLRPEARALLRELAKLNKKRVPWSRLAVVAYAKSSDRENRFARHLVERRSKELLNYLVRNGLEGRRLEARGVLVDAPLLIDPLDSPSRYNQAIELLPLDR